MIDLKNWIPRTTSTHDATAPTIIFMAEGDTSHPSESVTSELYKNN